MNAPVDVLAVMDRWVSDSKMREFTDCMVGAKDATREAEEARADVAALIEASAELVANLLSITKRGIRTPISTRQAALNLQHAVARARGDK